MLPIQREISAYNHYDSNKPEWIIIHYVGAVSTAANNARYFAGGNRNASAHCFVDDTSIYQSVEFFNGAWHIGNSVREPNNWNSIGIEMCCQPGLVVSEQTENNTIELVRYLMQKYNIDIDHVRTHAWTTNYGKICPNWSANNWARWNNFISKIVSGSVLPQPSGQLYRIRKSWDDAASQKGAFRIQTSAIAQCPKGYSVFDEGGNVIYSNNGNTSNQVPPSDIAVYYRTAIGSKYYDWVKDLTDYAGDKRNACTLFMAYPAKGELHFRVSPISEQRYYPEVQNYYSPNGHYDEAGVANVPFDKLQIRFDQPGYAVRYRVMCNGVWLPYVQNENSYADGPNGYAGLGDGVPITAVEVDIVKI